MRVIIIGFWLFPFLFFAEELQLPCSNDQWHSDLAHRACNAQFLYEHPSFKAHRESVRIYINNMPPEEAYLSELALNDDTVSPEIKLNIYNSIVKREEDSEEVDSNAFGVLGALGELHRQTYQLIQESPCLLGCKIESDLEDIIIKCAHLSLRHFIFTAFKAKVFKRKPQEG